MPPSPPSDVYLERLLEGVARGHGQELDALIDEFLVLAWRDKGAWEPEIRLLDGIGQTFGSFSPRSMAELHEYARLLPDISEQFTTYAKAWEAALHGLTAANLERFLASKPRWQERLNDQALAALEDTERRALVHILLTEPLGTPTPLQVLRGEQWLRLTLTPQRYPIKWPALLGPPTVGSDALPLRELKPYRGTLPVALTHGGPYLLFFWATWCAPCKASLPEVVAFERDSGIPVVAITDKPPAKLDAFFTKYDAPFPAIIAVDELRRSFLAYGVSGTPTFVLADAAGKVHSVLIGYRPEVGLALPGWSWTRQDPAPAQEVHS
jgi:thiol-disulfide isomerase/thioredoxin